MYLLNGGYRALRRARIPSRLTQVRSTSTDVRTRTNTSSTTPQPSTTDVTKSPGPLPFGSNIVQPPIRHRNIGSGRNLSPRANDPSLANSPWLYRDLSIHNLEHGTTLTDITHGIATTAPVSMVRELWFIPQPATSTALRSARVVFYSQDAALQLAQAAREKTFQVRGMTPSVYITDISHAHFKSKSDMSPGSSRVLVVQGMWEEFARCGVEEMKEVIRANPISRDDALLYGFESEPIRWEKGDGECIKSEYQIHVGAHKQVLLIKTKLTLTLRTLRQVTWAFFSCTMQAIPFKQALEMYFAIPTNPRLRIKHVADPCLKPGHRRPLLGFDREHLIVRLEREGKIGKKLPRLGPPNLVPEVDQYPSRSKIRKVVAGWSLPPGRFRRSYERSSRFGPCTF